MAPGDRHVDLHLKTPRSSGQARRGPPRRGRAGRAHAPLRRRSVHIQRSPVLASGDGGHRVPLSRKWSAAPNTGLAVCAQPRLSRRWRKWLDRTDLRDSRGSNRTTAPSAIRGTRLIGRSHVGRSERLVDCMVAGYRDQSGCDPSRIPQRAQIADHRGGGRRRAVDPRRARASAIEQRNRARRRGRQRTGRDRDSCSTCARTSC